MTIKVHKVSEVIDHPNADRLSLVKFNDHTCISGKLEDGSPRYKVGDLVIFFPDGTPVKPDLLRNGYWDEENDRPGLGGEKGNVVTAMKIRKVLTEGILLPINEVSTDLLEGDDVTKLVVETDEDN